MKPELDPDFVGPEDDIIIFLDWSGMRYGFITDVDAKLCTVVLFRTKTRPIEAEILTLLEQAPQGAKFVGIVWPSNDADGS